MSTNSRGRQPQSYYKPGFVDMTDHFKARMSLEKELERISQAFIAVKEELEELRKQIGGNP